MKIYLCRHGQTILNVAQRWQGQNDSALTEKGVLHAKQQADYLATKKIDVIFSSSLGRAKATALHLRKKFPNAPYLELDVLKEINNGEADGMLIEETKKKWPELIDRINLRDLNHGFPGGESYQDVVERLQLFVKELKEKHADKTIAIFGHAGMNRMLLRILLNLSDEETIALKSPHNTIYEIDLSNSKPELFHITNGERKKGFVY